MVDQRMKAQGRLELSGQEFSMCPGVFYSLSLLIAPTPGEARINVPILQTRKLRHTVLNLTKSTRELRLLSVGAKVVLVIKNLPASAGDIGDAASVPGSGRSPGGGHGNSSVLAWRISWTEEPGGQHDRSSSAHVCTPAATA